MNGHELEAIEWSAPSHLPHRRSNDWYWAVGLIAAVGTIASILWANYLFAAIIIVAAGSMLTLAARHPRDCEVHLTQKGVAIDRDFYPYRSLQSFWISTEHSTVPKLFLTTKAVLHPHIGIILPHPAEEDMLRSFLSRFLPEESGHSLGSWFAEVLGL